MVCQMDENSKNKSDIWIVTTKFVHLDLIKAMLWPFFEGQMNRFIQIWDQFQFLAQTVVVMMFLCKNIDKNREKISHLKGTTQSSHWNQGTFLFNELMQCLRVLLFTSPGFGSMIPPQQQKQPQVKLVFKQFLRWKVKMGIFHVRTHHTHRRQVSSNVSKSRYLAHDPHQHFNKFTLKI